MALDLLGFILAVVLGTWMLSFTVKAVRQGRIHHTDSTSTWMFRCQPIRFILVAVIFVLLGILFYYYAILRATALWKMIVD